MSGKKLPTLNALRWRHEQIVERVITLPPPRSDAEVKERQWIDWYCDLHEVLFKWVDEGERPT